MTGRGEKGRIEGGKANAQVLTNSEYVTHPGQESIITIFAGRERDEAERAEMRLDNMIQPPAR